MSFQFIENEEVVFFVSAHYCCYIYYTFDTQYRSCCQVNYGLSSFSCTSTHVFHITANIYLAPKPKSYILYLELIQHHHHYEEEKKMTAQLYGTYFEQQITLNILYVNELYGN